MAPDVIRFLTSTRSCRGSPEDQAMTEMICSETTGDEGLPPPEVRQSPTGCRYERTPAQGVQWHPVAEVFPWMDDASAAELREDIRKNGVLEPIVFLDGAILDGRNRYMAARELGIEYPRVEYEGDDPFGYVIAKNLHRRHLTESQRSIVASRLATKPRGSNQHVGIPTSTLTQTQAAEQLKVSRDSVIAARKVTDEGAPELVAAVERGEVSVNAAAGVATLPKDEQAELVGRGAGAVRAAATRVRTDRAAPSEEPEAATNGALGLHDFIERARRVLGRIDLDPASDVLGQSIIKAELWFNKTNSLEREWDGCVWLTLPEPLTQKFVCKLLDERDAGRVKAAIVLTHSATQSAWFQRLAQSAAAMCFTRKPVRLSEMKSRKSTPSPQDQVLAYFGPDTAAFFDAFQGCGVTMQIVTTAPGETR